MRNNLRSLLNILTTLLSSDKIKILSFTVINYMINYFIKNIVDLVILLERLNNS